MYLKRFALLAASAFLAFPALAQYQDAAPKSEAGKVVLTLEDALKVALSENTSVKVADMEIERQQYARKGSYAALLPQVSASGMYSYALKKQKVYFGSDKKDDDGEGSSGGGGMAGMMASLMNPIMYYIQQLYDGTGIPFVPYVDPDAGKEGGGSSEPMEMGRTHSVTFGLSAQMPLVNFQLWESLRLTGDQVELAVEQARESRLGTVASVKQAFYGILFAKEAYKVYNSVYENAVENFRLTEMRYNAAKASELDLTRAKANVAAAIPNLYNAENSVELALWQLKAVMGVDLDRNIDIAGTLEEYAGQMFSDIAEGERASLDGNSQLRQLAQQAEMLSRQIRMQQYAYLPTLALTFSYSYLTQSDIFNLSQWKWFPSSTVGLSLSIPIFSGGEPVHPHLLRRPALPRHQADARPGRRARPPARERRAPAPHRHPPEPRHDGHGDAHLRRLEGGPRLRGEGLRHRRQVLPARQEHPHGPEQRGTHAHPVPSRRLPGHLQLRHREGRPGTDPRLRF